MNDLTRRIGLLGTLVLAVVAILMVKDDGLEQSS